MPCLFRWLFFGCLGRVAAVLITLLAIFMIAEAFDKIRYLGHEFHVRLMVEYLLLKIPFMISEFMPMILLLASSIYITELSRNHELVALRAAGLGVNKIVVPLLAVAFMGGSIAFAIGEWVTPLTNQRVDRIDRVNIHHRPDTRQGIQWLKDGHRFFRLQPLGGQKFHLVMLETDQAGHWQRRIDAARASYRDGVWVLDGVDISRPKKDGIDLDHVRRIRLSATAGPDTVEPPSPRQMRFFELMHYATDLERAGLASSGFEFSLQRKLAIPVLCLIMVLLAVALCMNMGARRGAGAWGIAASITLGLGAYVVTSTTQLLATAGYLPAGFAAWLPNLIAIGFTGFLLLHREGY